MLSLSNQNFNTGQVRGSAMLLHRGPHGVLEQLVEDVIQVGWRVTDGQGSLLAFLILDQSLP